MQIDFFALLNTIIRLYFQPAKDLKKVKGFSQMETEKKLLV